MGVTYQSVSRAIFAGTNRLRQSKNRIEHSYSSYVSESFIII